MAVRLCIMWNLLFGMAGSGNASFSYITLTKIEKGQTLRIVEEWPATNLDIPSVEFSILVGNWKSTYRRLACRSM